MSREIRWAWMAVFSAALLVTACSEDEGVIPGSDDDDTAGDDDDDDTAGDDDDTAASDCVDVWVTSLQEVDASTDVTADWTALTADAYGAPFAPLTDVTALIVWFLNLTAEEAQQAICDDSLVQSDLAVYYEDTCDANWEDGTYSIDTSQFADHTLAVSLYTDGDFRTIALADVVSGAGNRVLLFEDGGAVAP